MNTSEDKIRRWPWGWIALGFVLGAIAGFGFGLMLFIVLTAMTSYAG